MIPVLLAGLAGVIGGMIVVHYWDDIVNWLKDFLPKVKEYFENLKTKLAHAAVMVAEKVKDAYVAIKHKLYYKEEGQWMEQTTTRQISEDEVPPFIRDKIAAQEQEVDITAEIENELQLTVG